MKPLMLITGPVATRSGYGSHSRDLVRSLISMDKFDIQVNSLRWGNCPMNALDDKNPNDKVIIFYFLMFCVVYMASAFHTNLLVFR